jgi:hypothetical protein
MKGPPLKDGTVPSFKTTMSPAKDSGTSRPAAAGGRRKLSTSERELLREVLRALREIRYGSVILTVHDGHLVEIQKNERIRRASTTTRESA